MPTITGVYRILGIIEYECYFRWTGQRNKEELGGFQG